MRTVYDWIEVNFGDQLDLIRNGYSGTQVNKITEYPVSRIETISDGTINFNKTGYVENIPYSYLLNEGDILFSNINSLKHIGKVAYVNKGINLYHGMNLLVFRPSKQINSKFLFYKLVEAKPWFEKMAAQAVNQASINQEELKKLQLNVPTSKYEQLKIVEILENINHSVEQTKALIAKQERIKTGIVQELLTKGIEKNGNVRSEETHEFTDSTLGRIPKEWTNTTFRSVTKVRQGLQIPIEKRYKDESENRYVYITVQYLNNPDKYLEYIENPSRELLCNKDEILFTRTGNTGQIITGVEGVFHNNFFKVMNDESMIIKDYVVTYLKWNKIQGKIIDLAGTTTIPDLNHGDFYDLPVFFPDKDEQKRIVDIVNAVSKEIENEKFELKKLCSIKQALMQDILTGKKSVTLLLNETEVTN